MNFAFRVDASIQIGTGHVMRCLTLASKLKQQGHDSLFICRAHTGHLGELIKDKGNSLCLLSVTNEPEDEATTGYKSWLGVNWQQDVRETVVALEKQDTDWLVVDHYALDDAWENVVAEYVPHVMVIDDLANRNHVCDVLLDQNLVTDFKYRYDALVAPTTKLLLGPDYWLLDESFHVLKKHVRVRDKIENLLVFFGGADKDNATLQCLKNIEPISAHFKNIDVIVGASNPHAGIIEAYCETQSNMQFYKQIPNMAEHILQADLAIGGGGSVTWERMFLGLPSIVFSMAENQIKVAEYLDTMGYVFYLGKIENLSDEETQNKLMNYCSANEILCAQSKKLLAIEYQNSDKLISELVN